MSVLVKQPVQRKGIPPTTAIKFKVVVMRMSDNIMDSVLVHRTCAIGSMTGKEYHHNKGKGKMFKSIRNAHNYFTKKANVAGPNYYVVLVRKCSNTVIRAVQGRNTLNSWMYSSVAGKA